ncbi:MAG: (2Fe-2S)-binding protein [Gammaproteobacteria bacterium]|jgi:predicted molibdopterin-dependent oxidoreductase YjgC|nr:(2Fe-2S)-binding protein [Gammaproteobacteria bacterium]MDX2462023.1 (2Fe-2S)-binding protein [Gammaproteobacteria bacterium]
MRRLSHDGSKQLRVTFEGEELLAHPNDTVAAALLATGQWQFRTTPVSEAPRGPFCMMGVCFECLVEIDGVANRQACMTEVRDGMRINRQSGANHMGIPVAVDDASGTGS